ncbi:MAG: prepilin peptidase [Microbacteriaceae bacterium]|nr:prepilin peptidase [Microbacteriaceae bacterium]
MPAVDLGTVWIVVAICALGGLLIGSFLNVVAYRIPAGISLSRPPSACPECRTRIKPYDNVPVVSWLVLRARCRSCGTRISARYPLVEAGTAVFFAAIALLAILGSRHLDDPRSVVAGLLALSSFLYLAAITVALALIDIDTHKLPNRIVLPAYVVSAVLLVAASIVSGQFDSLLRAAMAMAALALVYFIMAFAYPGGMGLGDAKLAGVIGIYLGWVGWGALVVGALSAFLLGGLYAVILLILRKANRKSGIPFGPWMLAGAWLGIGIGNIAFAGYLSIFGLTGA